MNMNLDVKLLLSPIVVLHKLPEEELLSEKITHEVPSEEEKINFLNYFGLVPKNWDASLPSTLKESLVRRKEFCCAGFAKTQRRKSNHQISEMCMLPHGMRLHPRVCVKKWLGGEIIKVSKHKYRELEESLIIPKTHNHYSCKEKPKKPLPSNTNSESVNVNLGIVKENPCLAKPHDEDEKSKENWGSHCSREVNCVLRSGENIFSSNQIPSSNLPVRYSTSKDQHFHQKPLENKNGTFTILKEVRVCLERWEGEGCIVLPKKMNGMKNYCERPKGNRKCCKSR